MRNLFEFCNAALTGTVISASLVLATAATLLSQPSSRTYQVTLLVSPFIFSGLTAGFAQDNSMPPIMADGLGDFEYGVACTTAECGLGGSMPNPGPLDFTVTTAGALSPPDFIANSKGFSLARIFAVQ